MYDIVIVGGGIAGLSAAIYAARANKKILLIEKNCLGGQIINSSLINNYPGFLNIDGFSFVEKLKEQIKKLNVIVIFEDVISIDINEITTTKNKFKFKTCIIATGLRRRNLNVPGEKEFIGKGLSYCATCDGNFFRGKTVAVIGGGNTSIEESLYLSNIVSKLYLIHRRDRFSADELLLKKLKDKDNVEFILNSNVTKIIGKDTIEQIILNNDKKLSVDGVFVAIGQQPDILFNSIIKYDKRGFIISDDCKTNIENIFVAGDCRTKDLRQLITAASDGAQAATYAIEYLNQKES